MSKANRKAITTVIAIELTRRSTMAALLASAALCGPASAAATSSGDPIFMLIEEHKAARAAFAAVSNAAEAIENRCPRPRRPRVQLGMTDTAHLLIDGELIPVLSRPFYANERDEIDRHINSEIKKGVAGGGALNEERAKLLAEWDRQEAANANPELEAAEARCNEASSAEDEATIKMLTTAPTTLAGAVALLCYLAENNTDGEAFNINCGDAGDSFSALVSSLIVALAPLVRQ